MKTQRKWLAIGLSVAAGIAIVGGAIAGEKDQPPGFLDKMKQWQAEMSETFRKAFDGASKNSTGASASVDLREQSDSYLVRLSLPGRALDKVEVDLDGNHLRIDAPAEGNASRYRQSITLTGAGRKPEIERKPAEGVIVVKVPKTSAKGDASGVSKELPTPFLPLLDQERDVLERIDRMQQEMDRIFKRGFEEFRLLPAHRDFFDKSSFGSSVDVREEDGNYVVRAYLPGRDSNDVNVTADDRTLKIEAKAEKSDKGGSAGRSHYSQFLTLPGPVDATKMRVDRKEGMLVVTLPQASSK